MNGKVIGEALTFDDVLLVPAKSQVVPSDIDTKTKVTRNVTLNIPVLSAAMDTVTEASLAIGIAQEGGLGIIHRNLTIDDQAKEVSKVKRFEANIVTNPFTLRPTDSIGEASTLMKEQGISGIPIVTDKKLVGIITSRDLRGYEDNGLKIQEVMTKKLVTAKVGVTLAEAKQTLNENKIEKLLIVDDEFTLRGLITMKDILKQEQNPNAIKDKNGRLLVGAAVGTFDLDRVGALVKAGVNVVVLDTAHGHSKNVIETVKAIKKKFTVDVIAGNIATAEAVRDLVRAGADGLKIGIGPGSICTTRIIAGVGVPQLSAVLETSKEASKSNTPIIADGGIRHSGDISKAIGAGADCVMLGNLLAGTQESPGEHIIHKGRSFKSYRGMGSLGALSALTKDRYGVGKGQGKLVPEGIEGIVPIKGTVREVLFHLVGGLRSGMGYCGAGNIKEFHKKAKFIKITSSSLRESHPHDVIITKEAPNYSIKTPETETE